MKKSELVCLNCRYRRREFTVEEFFCVKNAPSGLTDKTHLYVGVRVPYWFSCGEGEWREAKEQGQNEKKTTSHKVYHYDDYDAEEG